MKQSRTSCKLMSSPFRQASKLSLIHDGRIIGMRLSTTHGVELTLKSQSEQSHRNTLYFALPATTAMRCVTVSVKSGRAVAPKSTACLNNCV